MTREITTILEASREWVGTFNAFPLEMIIKLFNIDVDGWREITPISKGCRVWSNKIQEIGYIKEIKENEDGEEIAVIELDNGEKVEELKEDLSREEDDYFPMWEQCGSFPILVTIGGLKIILMKWPIVALGFMNQMNLVIFSA